MFVLILVFSIVSGTGTIGITSQQISGFTTEKDCEGAGWLAAIDGVRGFPSTEGVAVSFVCVMGR